MSETEPTADHIARALVAASRLTEEDPIAVAERRRNTLSSRARCYALEALLKTFPDEKPVFFVERVGFGAVYEATRQVSQARRALWWSPAHLNKVMLAVTHGVLS